MAKPVEPDIELSNLPGFNTVEDILKRDSLLGGTMARELTFRKRTQERLFRCDLILCFVHDYDDAEAVRFEFEEVHGLESRETHQVSGLAIKDVSSRAWDRTRYEIYDYEGDAIHFYCGGIRLSRTTE